MKIGFVAGEPSGDLLGAGLICALKERYPNAIFEGIAGPHMQEAGCQQLESSESLSVFGIIELFVHLPRLLRLQSFLIKRWSKSPPDVFIGIDSPDFNLRLEKKLRASGIKVIHYVSPSIWAWRSSRIKTIKAAVDKVLCILPFEVSIYKKYGIDAVFVGHPRADSVPLNQDIRISRRLLGINSEEVIAILPGSRISEILFLGDIFVNTAKIILDERKNVQFIIPIATPALRKKIELQVSLAGLTNNFLLIDGNSEHVMISADVVLLASGTAALESALLQKPTVAAYKVNKISYLIFKLLKLAKLSKFTLPNLLTETPLVPEFIQNEAQPALIAEAVIELLKSPSQRQLISKEFSKLKAELALNTNQCAADAVTSLIK
ncbi:MAG: lipid-A-disaccharide synthase [Gammaproteobacteria bacterium]|nr:lipid-A-disaccharide synthase [Gammaproteobacteria bacterium]